MSDTTLTCLECKKEYTAMIPVCHGCYKELLSDKYDDFVCILATLNDKLKELINENLSLKKTINENNSLKKET